MTMQIETLNLIFRWISFVMLQLLFEKFENRRYLLDCGKERFEVSL